MNIKKARIKAKEHWPAVEFCCSEMESQAQTFYGLEVDIDLDMIVSNYSNLINGHCGQVLPYDKAVWGVCHDGVRSQGYFPFDLLDIDEGQV